MSKYKCPHCKKELNLGSLVAKAGWSKVSKEERSKRMSAIAKMPRKK